MAKFGEWIASVTHGLKSLKLGVMEMPSKDLAKFIYCLDLATKHHDTLQ